MNTLPAHVSGKRPAPARTLNGRVVQHKGPRRCHRMHHGVKSTTAFAVTAAALTVPTFVGFVLSLIQQH